MTIPWTVDVTKTGVYLCAGVDAVAEFCHSGRHGAAISQEEAVANATLAAAAGGLLEALRDVRDYISDGCNFLDEELTIENIDKAIAAATRKLP